MWSFRISIVLTFVLLTIYQINAEGCAVVQGYGGEDLPSLCKVEYHAQYGSWDEPCMLAIFFIGGHMVREHWLKDKGKKLPSHFDDILHYERATGIVYRALEKTEAETTPAARTRAKRGDSATLGMFGNQSFESWFHYNISHKCLEAMAGDSTAVWMRADPKRDRGQEPVYAYEVLLNAEVDSWLKAHDACKQAGANLPVFQHEDDEYPGLDLLHFNLLQRAMEWASMVPPRAVTGTVYKQKMGMPWKSCLPIGLVKDTRSKLNLTDSASWRWINGQPLKKPIHPELSGRYWLTDQPSEDASMGPMQFGYMTWDDAYGAFDDHVPRAGYFNDVTNWKKSLKQKSPILENKGNVLDLHCPENAKSCMPCSHPTLFTICQKRIDSDEPQDFNDVVDLIPKEDQIPVGPAPPAPTAPPYVPGTAPTKKGGNEGVISDTTRNIILLILAFVVLIAAAIYFGTTSAAKKVKKNRKGHILESEIDDNTSKTLPENTDARSVTAKNALQGETKEKKKRKRKKHGKEDGKILEKRHKKMGM